MVGDIVIVKDDALAGRSWPLGRITATHQGDDGIVRVVDVLLRGKEYRRSTNRLILLLEEDIGASSPPEDVRDQAPEEEKIAA